MKHSAKSIAEHVGGELVGSGEIALTGINSIGAAKAGELTFLRDGSRCEQWKTSAATAVLVGPDIDLEPGPDRALIRVSDADIAVAKALELFAPPIPRPEPGVHASAVVDSTAQIGAEVAIGANAVVGKNTVIGDRSVIHAGAIIGEDVTIGERTTIWYGTVVRERCRIGDRCEIHANVTIGSDGFGYRPAADGRGVVKIPQIGTVVIGNDVEIGSGTCVDRGKFAATTIGDGCKIDNLVQIAHNCALGRCVIMAGCTALAGSVTVGDGAMIGGGVNVKDQIRIGSGTTIAGGSGVMSEIPDGETWAGYPARPAKMARLEYAAIRKLPELVKKARQLERENR